MKLSKLLFILVLATSSLAFSQIEKDTLVAYQYYQKADSLLEETSYIKSIEFFKKALPIYKKYKAWERVASCYSKISENQVNEGELEKSLTNSKKALNICDKYLTKNHPEKASAYENIGVYYQEKAIHDTSFMYFQKSLKIREKLYSKYHPDVARSYNFLATHYYYTEKYNDAVKYYKKELNIYLNIFEPDHEDIGEAYNNLGVINVQLQRYDKAVDYYKKSLNIRIKKRGKDHFYVAHSYANIGIVYADKYNFELALEYCEKAVSILEKENNRYSLSMIYIVIGSVYKGSGQGIKALQYYNKSLDGLQKIYGKSHPKIALVYNNISSVYRGLFNIEKSLFYKFKALAIYKKAFGENHSQVATIYNEMGIDYQLKKDYDTALDYLNKALGIRKEILDENHSHIAYSYKNIGSLYYEKKDYDTALDYYQKSLDILHNTSTQDLYLLLSCYNNIGIVYDKQKKYSESIAFFDKAIINNIKTKYEGTFENTFNPKQYSLLSSLFETLLKKAKTLQKRFEEDNSLEDLTESISLYKFLDQLVDHFRQSYQNYEDKVNLAKNTKEMYRDAITAHLLKFKIYNNITDLEKARYYAEKSKSNTLKNLLLENSAKNFSELPEELITLENTLKSNRAFYKSRIVSEQSKDSMDTKTIQEYEGKLFDVTRRQDSLTKVLEQDYPKYYKLKHSNKVISVSEIQEKLDKNTTLLEFFTTDSTTYAFTISKTKFQVKELQAPKLEEKIKVFREATTSKDIIAYKQLGYELYNMLIQPIKQNLERDQLIIIPDESLWHLNFELLLTKEKTSESSSELPYLLRDYAISYANSATLLFNPFQEQKQEIKQEGCLAFSFSDSTNVVKAKNMSLAALRDTGDDLPGTRKEIRAIADIIDGQYYFGADADEANFKKNASKYKILHLALHGDVDNERPQNSKLYFTKSKDTIEDSYLYGHELFALNIPSQLTVLSACNTGTGKIAKGEGIMSLGNAFQYAGTKSLLLSSWEVPDETTPELMAYFYTNLKKGMNKAKALQQAKLQYLQKADIYKAAPFYWGGFYLVGDTAPIDFGINSLWYWGIGVVLLLLLLGVFLCRKSNKLN